MTIETLPATTQSTDEKREVALLKALGLDKVQPEQRELALAIANRYDLDPMLRHLVLIDGRPFITRDGLLWVAHRSRQLDGIEVDDPVLEGGYWRTHATTYRKDMTRPFRYPGRYPAEGKNKAYAPEMAIKVAESMSLRRAFNISAPSADERWAEVAEEQVAREAEQPSSLAELVAAKAEAISDTGQAETVEAEAVTEEMTVQAEEFCEATSPYEGAAPCTLPPGHKGNHRSAERETW